MKASIFSTVWLVAVHIAISLPGVCSDSAVLSISGESTFSTCAFCNTGWGSIPTDGANAKSTTVIQAIPFSGGCHNSSFPSNVTNANEFVGKTVLFQRGVCNFSEMVRAAVGAVGVLVINGDTLPPVVPYGGNITSRNTTLCMISNDTATFFIDSTVRGSTVSVQLYYPSFPIVDGAAGVFLALALFILYVGSMWNTEKERQAAIAAPRYQQLISADQRQEPDDEQQVLTRGKIIFFVAFASVFLILLYFFYKYLIYVVLVMFAIFGWLSLYGIVNCYLESIVQPLSTTRFFQFAVQLPKVGKTPYVCIIALIVTGAVAWTWLFTRHASFTWVLQDVLAVPILITVIRVVVVPNLKMATILLSLLLCYDVFFVFITPHLTSSGDSVMVHAATGGQTSQDARGCQSYSNMMPFLLRLPSVAHPPCACAHYSFLGFGDVALPGTVVALALRFDYVRGMSTTTSGGAAGTWVRRHVYFASALVAYACGLVFAFVAAGMMETAQPALLYLSPSVLAGLCIPALCQGHFRELWNLSTDKHARRPSAFGERTVDPSDEFGRGNDAVSDDDSIALAQDTTASQA